MRGSLSTDKALIQAARLAAKADLDSLGLLVSQHSAFLETHLILRILLTYLPETIEPSAYTGLLLQTFDPKYVPLPQKLQPKLDLTYVHALTDKQASQLAKRLHLVELFPLDLKSPSRDDTIYLFVSKRAQGMALEAGILSRLSDLIVPFLQSPDPPSTLQTWFLSTVLPYVRRNSEFYPESAPSYTIAEFQELKDVEAIDYLLSPSSSDTYEQGNLARDLRCLIGPWIFKNERWLESADTRQTEEVTGSRHKHVSCPGWERVLVWLTSQAATSWLATADAFEKWNGPSDVCFSFGLHLTHPPHRQRYLDQTYAQAVLASAYAVQETTMDCFVSLYRMLLKLRSILGHGESDLPVQDAINAPPKIILENEVYYTEAKMAGWMRNDLLHPQNPLTVASFSSTTFIMALALSSIISARLGASWSLRRAGELFFYRDEREQKNEASILIRAIADRAPANDDEYLLRGRRELLWLRDWGVSESIQSTHQGSITGGPLAMISRSHIEGEFLQIMLTKSRYTLVRALYEDTSKSPLAAHDIEHIVYQSALNSFDNASNPDRTRGGLKKCDEILQSFPSIVTGSSPGARRIVALLKATHTLSSYRLVLKQGELFRPVVLRVHSDPISIIEKVLEQNPGAYLHLQEFLEVGINMIRAGLPAYNNVAWLRRQTTKGEELNIWVAERRIVAMCVEAALSENDFETAYSYVVSRLGASGADAAESSVNCYDQWSWHAALKTGQHIRNLPSQQPTLLGTASGNPEIRLLEQRLECLATSLRVAPADQLPYVLKTFRRCEEQLDFAIRQEVANEAAWDTAGDLAELPGSFAPVGPSGEGSTRITAAGTAAQQADEAPMSLFDLSRATAKIAQRNLTAISSLENTTTGGSAGGLQPAVPESQRLRKRYQLKEAATETLVSSVGWLIGANVNQSGVGSDE